MEEVPRHFPREIIYCRFPLVDGAGNPPATLRTAIYTLASLIQTKTPTLVVCSGGMSRSPAMTAVALSVTNGGSPDDWLKEITSSGPHDVAPTLWNEIRHCVQPE
jgi:protein-tyrosine phosphatase